MTGGAHNRNKQSASKQAIMSDIFFFCLQVDGPMTGAGGGGVIRGLKVTLHETNRNDDF